MKYYFAFITVRREATVSEGIEQMFNAILKGEKITVHTNPYLAKKHAESMLFDDDDDGVEKATGIPFGAHAEDGEVRWPFIDTVWSAENEETMLED